MFVRERTPMHVVLYGVYLVFEGLSFRAASRALEAFVERSHVSVWRWVHPGPRSPGGALHAQAGPTLLGGRDDGQGPR